ncbi:hypothetical protein G7085_20460 [Tessaracoccus sp. HDW20]|uniref:hypothetical protein n=1 Tax=Tessaracoccus coleopterorum TaxID=2714950 RepID=UPI0018D4754D|nr:hypothetical protein [Tessaracoccus coleopterorum]NHB86096.1 hypothetical protein [Tessaracoccus coleopterorum]
MHRYGAAIVGRPGLVSVHTLEDVGSERLVGLAIFESEADFEALAPVARAAVADDPFEVWERQPIEGLRLTDV